MKCKLYLFFGKKDRWKLACLRCNLTVEAKSFVLIKKILLNIFELVMKKIN